MGASMGNKRSQISEINVTPFVDVVLVLLVVLMVSAVQVVSAAIKVDLPTAASAGDSVPTTLNIAIKADGSLLLDGDSTSEERLVTALRRAKANDDEIRAVIAGDRRSSYSQVMHVIDLVKSNGIAKFALNIERAQ